MQTLSAISDSDLLSRLPLLVGHERAAIADVIEHLLEVDRRRLYLEEGCSSLYTFCIERLGYSEDEALKRVRVARLAERLPRVLEQLESGSLHLTGLFLLAPHLTEDNSEALLAEARGKSRREVEKLLARWFPRPDVEPRMEPVPSQGTLPDPGLAGGQGSGPSPARTGPGTGDFQSRARAQLEPLSASSYRVDFTASADLVAKIEQAKELLSHALPSGELPALFDRALDALIEREIGRRRGTGRRRERRPQKPGSRHVPVEVARIVWERDAGQCTVDALGRRCSERRFLTLEHKHPHALGGPSTAENLCLLCSSHNAHTARQVFGRAHIDNKRLERACRAERVHTAEPPQSVEPPQAAEGAPIQSDRRAVRAERGARPEARRAVRVERSGRQETRRAVRAERGARPEAHREQTEAKVFSALCNLGFGKRQVRHVMAELRQRQVAPEPEALLRAGLALLVPG